MSPGVASRKRFGGFGFALGCGCKDPKAVAVAAAAAVSASSPCSATETSTATTATPRRTRTHPWLSASASASTGTLTVPSASSSFLWEDADGDEIDCKRESSATTPSFSGLLRQLNELEKSVKSCGRKSPGRNYFSPPPPPPPPPPPLPSLPVQHRAVHSGDKRNSNEGHGNFSPPRPRPPSLQVPPTQLHRRVKSVDKVNRYEGDAHFTPLPPRPLPLPRPPQLLNVKKADRGNITEDGNELSPPEAPKHRKAKSCDNSNNGFGGGSGGRLDGSVAVVKQSEDPLSDFRRSMLNMIVENRIVTGDELRELLRRFLALNAPRHHDAILRAFAEIWDELFAATADPQLQRDPARPTAPRQRTPPRRRHPLPAWRV